MTSSISSNILYNLSNISKSSALNSTSFFANIPTSSSSYSTFAKEIYLAAKKGVPDVESNVFLKRIVDKAKRAQVPSDIINRAIDKAKGVGGEDYHEVIYEGFGPGASTLIIKTLTDNVNRTVGMVRAAFNKVHKSLGVTNSVAYNYDYLALLAFKTDKEEEIFEGLLEAHIEPIELVYMHRSYRRPSQVLNQKEYFLLN